MDNIINEMWDGTQGRIEWIKLAKLQGKNAQLEICYLAIVTSKLIRINQNGRMTRCQGT